MADSSSSLLPEQRLHLLGVQPEVLDDAHDRR
jgi:hypothetical protein